MPRYLLRMSQQLWPQMAGDGQDDCGQEGCCQQWQMPSGKETSQRDLS